MNNNGSPHVREMTIHDIPGVKEVIASSAPYVSLRTDSDYWLYAQLFRNTCLCLEVCHRLCGVAISFLDQTDNLRQMYIQDFAIVPGFRGRGHGSRLMEATLERARSIGVVKRVWLTSDIDNAAALALWKRHGFVNLKSDYRRDGYWITRNLKGPGKDRVVLEKHLAT